MAEGDLTGFSGHGWPQYKPEIDEFIEIMTAADCRSYLEVGCLYGDTLHYVGTRLPAGSRIVALDFPGQAGGRFRDTERFLRRAAKDLKKRGYDVHVIIGDSHKPEMIESARKLSPYDAVFIDGDHSIDGVRKDWQDYGPMGSIIGFHDICRQSQKYQDGVKALYDGLAKTHRHKTLTIGDTRRGIGVIWK
jgi:predicted O-methyltransferase YrrM